MSTFTAAEMADLVAIGDRMRNLKRVPKAEAIALMNGITDEQRKLVVDWMMYRMTGERPSAESRENGKVSARVGRPATGRKIQKGTV
jgi:hypothetical protein